MISAKVTTTVDAVATHYNELDAFYRGIWGEHVHHGIWLSGRESKKEAVHKTIELVAERAKIVPGSSVCDVGCGYGGTSRVLASEFGASVVGYTVSRAQADFAKTQAQSAGNPQILCQDWLTNEQRDASFDAVISIESSEHMPDKARFFSECFRVLRPGGKLVICAWLSKENPSAWEHRHLLEPICSEGRLPSMGSEKDYLEFYHRAGFISARYEDFSPNVKKTWSLSILGVAKHLAKKPGDFSYFFDRRNLNREFALTLFRLRLAYELGAMRYGIFTATKPGVAGSA